MPEPIRCMKENPSSPGVFCTVLIEWWRQDEHDGPHGWDYEKGETATTTRREMDREREEAGLGHLNERLRWLESGAVQHTREDDAR